MIDCIGNIDVLFFYPKYDTHTITKVTKYWSSFKMTLIQICQFNESRPCKNHQIIHMNLNEFR